MTLPTSPDPVSNETLLEKVEAQAEKIEKIGADVASLLEVFLKLWEQFNAMKDNPMLSAFFGSPRKK